MSVAIAWEGGEPGAVVKLDAQNIEARSERAKPPGSRPNATLPNGMQFRVKVHRCRKEAREDGLTFTIEGKIIDGARGVEAEMRSLLAPAPHCD